MTNIRREIKRVFENIHNTTKPDDLDGLLARYKMLLKKYNEVHDRMVAIKIKKKLKKSVDFYEVTA